MSHSGAANLASRLDAAFGALGSSLGSAPTGGAPGWSLRQDVQPSKAGRGVDEYDYSSDEEEAGPMTRQAIKGVDQEDSDQEEERYKEQLRATAHFRRAFEQEEEEDEFDRFAMHAGLRDRGSLLLRDDKPAGATEVSLARMYD